MYKLSIEESDQEINREKLIIKVIYEVMFNTDKFKYL